MKIYYTDDLEMYKDNHGFSILIDGSNYYHEYSHDKIRLYRYPIRFFLELDYIELKQVKVF